VYLLYQYTETTEDGMELQILQSNAGFYIGTTFDGMPNSRESLQYWPTREAAAVALASGEWTSRDNP
jgi:hypothetical protein